MHITKRSTSLKSSPPAFRRKLLLHAAACIAVAGACAAPSSSRPAPVTPGQALPGFDASAYPGDDAMRTWRTASPYRWVGYYLPAPCRRSTTWTGTRQRLESMGWRMAVLYVGQQTWDGVPAVASDSASRTQAAGVTPAPACTRELLTSAQGSLEALDAVTRASQEGFARGTTIYLDIEPMDSIPERMRSYYRAWVRGVAQDGRFRPGFYGHHSNANALFSDLRSLYTELGIPGTAPFWVARSSSSFTTAMGPSDSGFPFATAWQGRLNVSETHGGVTLLIDANVATGAP